ncbi:MAG TPA: response regulator [Dongiaceae bacterium]|nr:response regulator [Dongiaceae bacterium]
MAEPKILLVEDERIPAFNLQQRLRKLGYDVPSIVPSGTEALMLIEQQRPDMVLMDIHIEGDLDGIETASRIPPEWMIPVIYLTAYSEEATLQRAAATKPYGYLLKPFSERELHATIQMALQRHATELALRQREADLERSREDFRFLFANNPLPMWVFDLETLAFLDVNEAAVTTYGYAREEFLGMTITQIRPAEDIPKIQDLLTSKAPHHSAQNWRHLRKNGKIIEVDVFSYALTFDGRPARITVAVDVTQRNRAEEQLRQSQKMEAVGQLTSGVAHDFNNLLTIVQGNLELIGERLPPDPAISNMMSDALGASERGAMLTRRLLAYSRQQTLEPRTISLHQLVADLMALLRRTLDETIALDAILAPDLWHVRIDPGQLENALLNLAVNARDAMPNGGKLTIEAFNTFLDADYAAQNPEITPGEHVLVAVTDTGTGMPPEVVVRAFEPFFTTKAVGRGTGLGLSMVFGFVRQSGGHIKIYSEIGRGTSIKLYLPRATTALDVPIANDAGVTPYLAKGETVLVVEDDDGLRKMALTMLAGLGYRTLEAADGPQAMEHIARAGGVDLLLTDVVLPKGMNGPAIANAARQVRPGLKVLYMSGYTRDTIVHNGILDEGVHLIMKPFHKAELAVKVRKVLDAAG